MLSITSLFITLQVLCLVSRSYQACNPIDKPEHGRIRFQRTFYQVFCDPGYTVLGSPVVRCTNNEWESPPPPCVESTFDCEKPAVPIYGRMSCDRGPLTAGTACHFECNEGYELQGEAVRRCMTDGQWSGRDATCVPLSSTYCQLPPPLKDGTVVGCATTKLPRVSEKCSFRCNEGYILKGPMSLICTSSGTFTDASGKEIFPECVIASAESDVCFNHSCEQLCRNENGRAQCRCNRGFILNKEDQRTCKRNTGKPIHPARLSNLCQVKNGGCDHICIPTSNGVTCSCREGYRPYGPGLKRCMLKNPLPVSEPLVTPAPVTCQVNNGGCEHYCFINENGVQCYCKEGYELNTDGKGCIEKMETVLAVEGGKVDLKCDISPPSSYDEVALVLWYKDESTIPLYALDSRRGENVKHTRGQEFEGRAFLDMSTHPTVLKLERLKAEDEGEYRCRVDFKIARARISLVKLEILKNPLPVSEPLVTPAPVTCQVNNGGCEHYCSIRKNGIQCYCKEGYELHTDGKRCSDIDECSSDNLNNCQHYCQNTRGSYTCSCRRGYVLRDVYSCEDVDECSIEHLNRCQHYCRNTEGSYTCYCSRGFILMDGYKCEGCGKGSYWSFELNSCDQCPENSHTVSEGKTSIRDCICDPGFVGSRGDGIECRDINECNRNNFGCSDTCFNTPGGAYCSCPIGFKLDSDNKTCIDIDECSIKNGGCEGACHNLHGSFRCSCPEGFLPSNRDQYSCVDVDECLENNGGCEQICINHRGGYYCACETGYRLNSGLKNCTDIQCPALPVPPHSYTVCKKKGERFEEMPSYPHGTICNFKCNTGYKHAGDSKNMKCQKDGTWNGTLPTCRAQNCNPLRVPENGLVHPSFCSTQGVEVKQRCAFTCKPGYRLEGHPVLTCRNDLTWSYEEIPVCQPENVRPRIECPRDITTTLNPGKNTHSITLQEPITNVERYAVYPEWVFIGVSTEFPAGVTEVTFTTTSPNSNKSSKCVTTITVLDKEPPVFEYCPDPINIEGAGAEGEFVTWEEPVVTDNVQVESVVTISEPNTTFAPGTYIVEYIARDTSGNTASCSFDISVVRVNCSDLVDPLYGKANCVDWMFGKICQPQCDVGFIRNPEDPIYYSCDDSGTWEPSDVITDCLKFIPATSSSCPDGFMLQTNDETNEEVCVECPSKTVWLATTQKCEATSE